MHFMCELTTCECQLDFHQTPAKQISEPQKHYLDAQCPLARALTQGKIQKSGCIAAEPASADTSGHIAPNKWVCLLLPSTAQTRVVDKLCQKQPNGRIQSYGTQRLGSIPQPHNISASDSNSTATNSALAIHSNWTISGPVCCQDNRTTRGPAGLSFLCFPTYAIALAHVRGH